MKLLEWRSAKGNDATQIGKMINYLLDNIHKFIGLRLSIAYSIRCAKAADVNQSDNNWVQRVDI